ncbi:hypothetical protein BH10CYA1_BH10CYA1_29020 [soil metagenome]
MNTSKKISRFIATAAVMMLMLVSGSTPQRLAATLDSVVVQKADSTTNTTVPQPMPAADSTKFDGYALYKATFESLRDKHIMLTDTAARTKWVAEWENKHAKDGKLDTEKGADEACMEMMRSLNQRYDYYFQPVKTQEEESSQKPSYAGTGLVVTTLGAKAISKEHPFFIAMVIEGSPASRSGNLRKKDRIVSIDGKSVDGKSLEEAVAMLHGDNGVPVVISVERGATEKFNVTIIRGDYVRTVVHFKDLGDGVSYIKLDNFMSQFSVKEMFEALNKAAKGKALILDLRGNHGGSLEYVEEMAEFFLEDGTILEQHERQDNDLVTIRLAVQPHFAIRTETSSATPDNTGIKPEDRMRNLLPKDMPVVVLVDDDSYSASEILAGALQATHRAIVVGLPTGGKGVGQVVRKLPFGRSMHVTSFEFLPGGEAMDWVGVIPNIEVKQPANFDEDDATTDAQLKAALTQVKSMLDAQTQLQLKRDGLRKKNEDDFKKSRSDK